MQQNEVPHLTNTEFLVMKMLINAGRDLYGLEMVDSSEGKLKRGTIYVLLGRLQEKGYVKSKKEEVRAEAGAIPRRLYRPTGAGYRVFQAFEILMSGRAVRLATA